MSDDTNLCVTIPCHSFLLMTIPYINFFIKKVECKETILVSIYFISHQSLCIKLFNASKTSWMLKRISNARQFYSSILPTLQSRECKWIGTMLKITFCNSVFVKPLTFQGNNPELLCPQNWHPFLPPCNGCENINNMTTKRK